MNGTQRMLILVVVALASLSQPATAQVPNRLVKDPNVIEEFPFAFKSRSSILVPVRFGNRDYLFAVDTGSSLILYDSAFKSQLGPAREILEAITPSGKVKVEHFEAPQAFLGTLSLQTVEYVGCTDLNWMRKATKTEVYGIIGMSFLKKYVLKIDFDTKKLGFLKNPSPEPGFNKDELTFSKGGCPLLAIELPQIGKRQFVVDTGFNLALSLESVDFGSLLQKTEIKLGQSMQLIDLSGVRFERRVIVSSMTICSLGVPEVPVCESSNSRNRLGLQVLSAFDCTFDFPAHEIYLNVNDQSANHYRK